MLIHCPITITSVGELPKNLATTVMSIYRVCYHSDEIPRISSWWLDFARGEIELNWIEVNIGKIRKLGKTWNSSLSEGNLWWESLITLNGRVMAVMCGIFGFFLWHMTWKMIKAKGHLHHNWKFQFFLSFSMFISIWPCMGSVVFRIK